VPTVLQVHKELKGFKVLQVLQLVLSDWQGLKGVRVHKELLDPRQVHKDPQEQQDHKDLKVRQGLLQEPRDQ